MYFAACFVIFMVGIIGILALIQKFTGIQIFDDTPMDDDGYYW